MPNLALTKPPETMKEDALTRIRVRIATGDLETPEAIAKTVERVRDDVVPDHLTPVEVLHFRIGGLPE